MMYNVYYCTMIAPDRCICTPLQILSQCTMDCWLFNQYKLILSLPETTCNRRSTEFHKQITFFAFIIYIIILVNSRI